ncbi:hypothetical protein JVU11DRAFT_10097 [Chiua virens]|nr:hypothetical protein JVU11DRAFT_10097 [Chiua virens]
MSTFPKQERIEEFLRKSLLGEELINTQFHLFSSRSSSSGRVVDPRVLCANNDLLAKSSRYFLDLLSSDTNPSDPSLLDLTDENDVPNNLRIDDYGYESDSDLDECNDLLENVEKSKDQTATTPSKTSTGNQLKDDDELSDDGSVSSDMFVMSPEQPKPDDPFSVAKDGAGSVASSETAVQETTNDKKMGNCTAMRLRFLGSRHVLVKDTAFQTWYTLLNYLYTDSFSFLPLTSAAPTGQPHKSLTSSLDVPKCSAKSMYRLACKVGLDDLRDEAFFYIRSNLSEHNILKELSCSLASKHPELLEMELDVLYSHIATPPVVAGFPDLARRIANKELPHGADIIVGIHTRVLQPQPVRLSETREKAPYARASPRSVEPAANLSVIPEREEKPTPPQAIKLGPPPQNRVFVDMSKPASVGESQAKVPTTKPGLVTSRPYTSVEEVRNVRRESTTTTSTSDRVRTTPTSSSRPNEAAYGRQN